MAIFIKPVLVLLLGLFLLSTGFAHYKHTRLLHLHGITTTVDSVGELIAANHTKFGLETAKIFKASVRFKTRLGQEIVQDKILPLDVIEQLKAGQSVNICYLPDAPENNSFSGHKPDVLSFYLGLVLLVIGVFWLFKNFKLAAF